MTVEQYDQGSRYVGDAKLSGVVVRVGHGRRFDPLAGVMAATSQGWTATRILDIPEGRCNDPT